jgi:hypothetical protein
VLDGINMERKGVPAVIIVHDRFEVAAKTNAILARLPGAKMVVIPEGTGTPSVEEQRSRVDKVWESIVKGLTTAGE